MVVKIFEKYMQDAGYVVFNTQYPDVKEYIKEENGFVNILQVFNVNDDSDMDHETLINQSQNIRASMEDKDVHIMNLIFSGDMTKAEKIASDEYMCWTIDKQNISLIEDDSRIEDFYGLKQDLLKWIEETRILIGSNDLRAINEKLMNSSEREEYHEKSKKRPSPVSVVLVIVNVLIFLTSLLIGNAAGDAPNPFLESGCMEFSAIGDGQFYRLITAMFLHADFQHVISNMLLLYFMGEMVEHKTGSVRFAIIYFVSGIMGNVISYVYELTSGARYTAIGASGAVYGIMGALLFLVIIKTKGLDIPVRRMILMVAYCVYSSFAADHIDYAAHLGGLFIGFLLTAILCYSKLSKKEAVQNSEG